MKGKILKKVIAAALVLTLVSGAVPILTALQEHLTDRNTR